MLFEKIVRNPSGVEGELTDLNTVDGKKHSVI